MEEDLQVCLLFPGWEAEDEHVAVISAHDDDGLLGAGYAILAVLANEAEVYPSGARMGPLPLATRSRTVEIRGR